MSPAAENVAGLCFSVAAGAATPHQIKCSATGSRLETEGAAASLADAVGTVLAVAGEVHVEMVAVVDVGVRAEHC